MLLFHRYNVKLTIVLSWRLFFDLEFFFWLGVLIVHKLMQTEADVPTALNGGRNVNQIIFGFVN